MKRKFLSAAVFVLAAMLLQSLAASDSKGAEDQASWQNDLLAWRAQRATNLQAPEGWLSLIALGWLKEGDNSFGSAEDSRVQITGKAPAHIAIVRWNKEKGGLRLLPPAEGFPKDLLVDGQPAKEQALVADDGDRPSKLTIGTLTIIVIHRDEQFALRIKDLEASTRVGFHGLRWYAPNAPTACRRAGSHTTHPKCSTSQPSSVPPPTCPRRASPNSPSTDKFSGSSPCSKIRRQPIFFLFCVTPPAKPRPTAPDAFSTLSFPTMASASPAKSGSISIDW
jgi:hypothetical protein